MPQQECCCGGVELVKLGFSLKRRGGASLNHWFSKSLLMVGLWQRKFATEDAEGAESCCFLCVLCALCGFQNPFRKILQNPPNQAGDDPAKSREKFEQAFMEAFGRTGNGSINAARKSTTDSPANNAMEESDWLDSRLQKCCAENAHPSNLHRRKIQHPLPRSSWSRWNLPH